MNFPESLEYLYNLGNEVTAMKLGLTSTEKLLAALGNPEKHFLKIQVAGTNGKGSTCAFLEAICLAAGIKVGLYTSPHLISITERIKINGEEISEEDFARHATEVRKISEKLVESKELTALPTFFEQVTAIALAAFREAKVEIAILETGLGGRFDATTATNAEIVALTPIDFDHQDILGNSLAEIASEKAAIIREDTTVVLARQKYEAMNVILERCAGVKVEPIFDNCRTEINAVETINGRMVATFITDVDLYHDVWLSLGGRHQVENACLAIMLVEVLNNNFDFNISKFEVVEGLETAHHRGRLEFYKGILFDGAHNAAGAKALKDYLDEFIKQPITLVFGSMEDKDLREIAEILFPKAEILILTEPENPRSMKTRELTKFLPENFSNEKFLIAETVESALKIARKVSSDKNLICITGSLYLVGEAQKLLNNKSEI